MDTNKKSLIGFTIIEMMVVVTVMVLITVAAVPAFRSFTVNSRASNVASRLADTFRLARAEALTSGKDVIVCPILPGATPAAGATDPGNLCITPFTGNTWDAWLLFSDKNFNNTHDTGETIKYYEDIPKNTVLSTSPLVKYDASGFCVSGQHTFTINPQGCSGPNARLITVKPGSINVELIDCQ